MGPKSEWDAGVFMAIRMIKTTFNPWSEPEADISSVWTVKWRVYGQLPSQWAKLVLKETFQDWHHLFIFILIGGGFNNIFWVRHFLVEMIQLVWHVFFSNYVKVSLSP